MFDSKEPKPRVVHSSVREAPVAAQPPQGNVQPQMDIRTGVIEVLKDIKNVADLASPLQWLSAPTVRLAPAADTTYAQPAPTMNPDPPKFTPTSPNQSVTVNDEALERLTERHRQDYQSQMDQFKSQQEEFLRKSFDMFTAETDKVEGLVRSTTEQLKVQSQSIEQSVRAQHDKLIDETRENMLQLRDSLNENNLLVVDQTKQEIARHLAVSQQHVQSLLHTRDSASAEPQHASPKPTLFNEEPEIPLIVKAAIQALPPEPAATPINHSEQHEYTKDSDAFESAKSDQSVVQRTNESAEAPEPPKQEEVDSLQAAR